MKLASSPSSTCAKTVGKRHLHHRADTLREHGTAVRRVVSEMRQRLDVAYTLAEMSETAYMSPFHLNRVFRRMTGVPPRRFLTALRLEAAKRLLLTTEQKVTDISLDVGYQSLGTFTRRFTQLVGISPTRFRALATTGAQAAMATVAQMLASERLSERQRAQAPRAIVTAPAFFQGVIFVGLFDTPIPQAQPRACAVRSSPGGFHLGRVDDGDYYLAAMALPWSPDPTDILLYTGALRAGVLRAPFRVRGGRQQSTTVHLDLRRPDDLDPPILLAVPLLLPQRTHQQEPRRSRIRLQK